MVALPWALQFPAPVPKVTYIGYEKEETVTVKFPDSIHGQPPNHHGNTVTISGLVILILYVAPFLLFPLALPVTDQYWFEPTVTIVFTREEFQVAVPPPLG